MYDKKKINKILIVDDSKFNREILTDMLGETYEILEADNGVAAIEALYQYGTSISLILLDIVMPKMDGFEVLAMMNRYHWIEEIPVIVISAENSHSVVDRAYELGAVDYISRPFDEVIVCRRVINTIMLYSKQRRLISMVADQMYESEKSNTLMVSILSHIVEFRNGESGLHVLHIGTMTEMLLKRLRDKTDIYSLDPATISRITKAAAFHDIGKISVSESILNKQGPLTKEEFAIMKTHSMVGAQMLADLPLHNNEPLVKVAYEICRWHHERYDGKGYPDGLKGEEIPISAQVVSIADAYDALISERVYKKAYSHERALHMILNGECGAFNPLLLECLRDIADRIEEELTINSLSRVSEKEINNIVEQLLSHKEIAASNRTLSMLEEERTKFQFFTAMESEIQFEYTVVPSVITLSDWGAEKLGISRLLVEPEKNMELLTVISREELEKLDQALRGTTPECPVLEYEAKLRINGIWRLNKIICRTLWTQGEDPKYNGAIGKIVDIREKEQELRRLKKLASMDSLTNLPNGAYIKKKISRMLEEHPENDYVMVIMDMDCFKMANSERGHLFGDRILKYLADCLLTNIREDDLAARVGGDEFLVFIHDDGKWGDVVRRIFTTLTGEYEGFRLSVSMGIAKTKIVGRDYQKLYQGADMALFQAKKKGKGCYACYDGASCSQEIPTEISPIDQAPEEG